jgi:hypothetical protein
MLEVLGAEPGPRVGFDCVAQEPSVRQARKALVRIVPARIRRRYDRADPLFGKAPVFLWLAVQAPEQCTAPVEAVNACRQQAMRRAYPNAVAASQRRAPSSSTAWSR